MNKQFPWTTRPEKGYEPDKTLFIHNPKVSYTISRPIIKQCKIIELSLNDIIKLQYNNLEENKKVKENKCKWIKLDGCVCNALLKHGNKYCVRHMKAANKT